MVTTRKTSANVTPMPTASRTNSSMNTSKSTHQPTTESTLTHPEAQPINPRPSSVAPARGELRGPEFSDNVAFVSPEKKPSLAKQDPLKAKQKSRGKTPKAKTPKREMFVKRKSGGFSSWFGRAVLLTFTVYSLVICPSDTKLENGVCRRINWYKNLVTPYVSPYIDAVLSHPSVAPKLDAAKPYVDRAIVLSRPVGTFAVNQWQTHAVPQIQKLEVLSQPYVDRVHGEYRTHIAPHVRVAAYNYDRYQRAAAPYIAQAKVIGHRVWTVTEPALIVAWKQGTELAGKFIVAPLGQARQQYVDPHIYRMIEKVDEFAGGKIKPMLTAAPTPASQKPTESTAASSSEPTFYYTGEAEAQAAQATQEAATSQPEQPVDVPVSEINSAAGDDDEFDLDAFLAEISVGEPEPEPEAPPPQREETEEEKQERLRRKAIETAEKRADIEGRHTKWEAELTDLGNAETYVLIEKLSTFREEKAQEIQSPAIRAHVDGLETDAITLLKQTEASLKKILGSKDGGAKKVAMWDIVVEKVEKKYDDKVKVVEAAIQDWWKAAYDGEVNLVEYSIELLRDKAAEAQADIGMDYAWLDDVSYMDWNRYHELMYSSKAFAEIYRTIHNNTHPEMPAHPVLPLLGSLQEEFADIIAGFETNLSKIKRKGLRIFSGGEVGEEPEDLFIGKDPKQVEQAIKMAEAAQILQEKKQQPMEAAPFAEQEEKVEPVVEHAEEKVEPQTHEEL